MHIFTKDGAGRLTIVSLDNYRGVIITEEKDQPDTFRLGVVCQENVDRLYPVYTGALNECQEIMCDIDMALTEGTNINLLEWHDDGGES